MQSIEDHQKDTDSRLKKVETDSSSTMADILKALKELQSGPSSSKRLGSVRSESSTDLPQLEEVTHGTSEQEEHVNEEQKSTSKSSSPVFQRKLAQKRKAASHDDNAEKAKKLKKKHQRSKSSTPTQRQEQRNKFTSAMVSIPAWFPESWNIAAYLVNRFFWVHEAARHELFKQKKTKGQNYPCYRVPFNDLAIAFVKEYDEDRQKLYDAKKSNPDLALVEILPWYKLHSNLWKRPMIHPNSAKTSTQTFAFHTNTVFMDNFLDEIGGKFLTIIYIIL